MKYVDEFRDAELGRVLAGEIVATFGRYGVMYTLLLILLTIFLKKYHAGEVGVGTASLLFFVLLGITFAVLFGTLLPMLVAATSGDTISVGAPWFNAVNAPIFVALLFLMGVGPALPWGRASWTTLRARFALPVIVGYLRLHLRPHDTEPLEPQPGLAGAEPALGGH